MPFTLREPVLPDASEIAELHVATWRETYSHLLPEDFFTEDCWMRPWATVKRCCGSRRTILGRWRSIAAMASIWTVRSRGTPGLQRSSTHAC